MSDYLLPASPYTHCPDLWCVTAYFNPMHYAARRRNYQRFSALLRAAGIPLLTVECAFGADPFDLPPASDLLQVRSPDILWQKERLLNLAVTALPPRARKVAWLDADLLFTNPNWAVETSQLLERCEVVQPFARVIRLNRAGTAEDSGQMPVWGMARVLQGERNRDQFFGLDQHGHTGFAWAARRDLLDTHGLFDLPFDVGADHLMAHVFFGDLDSPCLGSTLRISSALGGLRRASGLLAFKRMLPKSLRRRLAAALPSHPNAVLVDRFMAWAQGWVEDAGGQVGYVEGDLFHLWHDSERRRAVGDTRRWLDQKRVDLATDLKVNEQGVWAWTNQRKTWSEWSAQAFEREAEQPVWNYRSVVQPAEPEPSPSAQVDVSILIVTYNSAREIGPCLESIAAQTQVSHEVIVVDNASADDTRKIVQAAPAVRLVANAENRGFSVAVNQASRLANGRYLLLLNPDTTLHPNAIERLVACLESAPQVGLCAPRLLAADGRIRHNCFSFETPWRLLWFGIGVGPLRRLWRWNMRRPLWDISANAPQAVEAVVGAAMLIRRETFDELGGLDEQFFMYCEDSDFCLRMGQAGWKATLVPQAVVMHIGGASAPDDAPMLNGMIGRYLLQSRYAYTRKHWGRGAMWLLRLAYAAAGALFLLIGWLARSPVRLRLRQYGGLLLFTPTRHGEASR